MREKELGPIKESEADWLAVQSSSRSNSAWDNIRNALSLYMQALMREVVKAAWEPFKFRNVRIISAAHASTIHLETECYLIIQEPTLPPNLRDSPLWPNFQLLTSYRGFTLLNYMKRCDCIRSSPVSWLLNSKIFFKIRGFLPITSCRMEIAREIVDLQGLASYIPQMQNGFLSNKFSLKEHLFLLIWKQSKPTVYNTFRSAVFAMGRDFTEMKINMTNVWRTCTYACNSSHCKSDAGKSVSKWSSNS